LEFGTWEGYGTALYCRYSSGSVITINLKNGESDMSGESAYPSSYYPETRNKFLGKSEIKISDSNDAIGWIYRINGYGDRVTQIFDNSKNLRLSDFGDKKFETIFIDGGHDEETVVNDTLLALDLLADNGIIIWHDFTMSFEDYISYNSVEGVFKAIHNLTNIFKNKEINLFWIQNSWLLLGRYKKIHINKCYLIC
jgi:hypothetical protein